MTKFEVKRGFKGVWIPREIWLNEELTIMEKLFLVEIDSLDNDDGCFASNAHFADLFGISKGRCSQIIKEMERKKYISISYEKNGKEISKRIIKVFRKLNRGVKKTKGGCLENAQGSNTVINNTKSINKPAEIINYLNEKADKNFKPVESNTKHVKARINEGYTLDEFKTVIDYTVSEWKGKVFGNGKNGSDYLRPSTLFNGKFDERLQLAREKQPNKQVKESPKEERDSVLGGLF